MTAGDCSARGVWGREGGTGEFAVVAALQSLKVGREIIYCDSCKRILYYDMQKS